MMAASYRRVIQSGQLACPPHAALLDSIRQHSMHSLPSEGGGETGKVGEAEISNFKVT